MMRPDMEQRFVPAYAALLSAAQGANKRLNRGVVQPLQSYRNWLGCVAHVEFADELVVAAATMELHVKLICVPYTPTGQSLWKISHYLPLGVLDDTSRTIVLGNNDVHYVWLT